MMKRYIAAAAAALMITSLLTGCTASSTQTQTASQTAPAGTEKAAEASEKSTESTEASSKASAPAASAEASTADADAAAVRVGSLKGPTSMGLVSLMDRSSRGETTNAYEFTMAGKADELVGKLASGELDIALIPANVASALYNKTKGAVKTADINTLGVLYVVSSDDSITSIADLKGKSIYMTGKGTTPEFAMNYLLEENGVSLSDVDMQFKSEAAEVAAVLKQDSSAIGVLPQPFATAACIQNEALKPVLDLTAEWNALNQESGSMMVTGVTVVRSEFLKENEAAVSEFIKDHDASARYTETNPKEAAELIAALGIVEKAPVAEKALPKCNIVCLTGEEMKAALEGYLSVLNEQDAKSIGGAMPGEDFYYLP